MIDFRYHLVSIIAVFLALAVGIVVGANALQPTTEAALRRAANTVSRQNTNLSQQNRDLKEQVTAGQNFAQAASGRLLGHLLAGQSVVLVVAPGSDSQVVKGVTAAIQQAGATVTGEVALQDQFFDPGGSAQEKLSELAQSLAPDAGVTLPGQAVGAVADAQQEAGQVIAAAIIGRDGVGLDAAQSHAVLSGFSQSGYLQISGPAGASVSTLAPATMAVVIAPAAPPASTDASPVNQALVAVAEQLQAASRLTVLAGSLAGSGPGTAIDDISGAGKVSTVDDADQPIGQELTVQALAELASGHRPASYGVGPGVVPSPAPTPSASPTAPAHQVTKR